MMEITTCHEYTQISHLDPKWESGYERSSFMFDDTTEFTVQDDALI